MRHYHKQIWITKYFLERSKDVNQIEFLHYEDDGHFLEESEDFGHGAHLFTKELLLELFFLALQPLPFYDRYIIFQCKKFTIVYLLSEILFVLMSVRIYFLIRCVLSYCEFMDAFSKKICRGYGFETGVKFTIKCQIMINPESTVMCIFFATVFIFAYLIRIFEMPYFRASKPGDPVFDSFFNAIWFTVITLTTIGYGDISPGTQPGMLLTILLAFWGALLLSLLVVTVSSIFNLDEDQQMALRHLRITRQAAKTILTGLKYYVAKKRMHLMQCKENTRGQANYLSPDSRFLELIKKNSEALKEAKKKVKGGKKKVSNDEEKGQIIN